MAPFSGLFAFSSRNIRLKCVVKEIENLVHEKPVASLKMLLSFLVFAKSHNLNSARKFCEIFIFPFLKTVKFTERS